MNNNQFNNYNNQGQNQMSDFGQNNFSNSNQINDFSQNGFANPNSNNKKGIGFTILLVILLIFLLLQVTGVFNVVDFTRNLINKDSNDVVEKNNDVEEDKEEKLKIDYEAKLRSVAKSVDSEGNYNLEEVYNNSDVFEKLDISGSSSQEAKKEVETAIKNVQELFFCVSGTCMAFEYNDEVYFHLYDIETDTYKKVDYNEFSSSLVLSTACANVDNNGNYSNGVTKGEEGYVHCESFVCEVKYAGNIYKKDCR